MSSGTFSGQNTNSLIEPVLRFLFPSISHSEVFLFHAFARKVAHVAEYSVAGFLLFRAIRGTLGDERILQWAFVTFLVIFALAAADEYRQSFVSTRSASFLDVGVDALSGALIPCVIVLRARHRNRKSAELQV